MHIIIFQKPIFIHNLTIQNPHFLTYSDTLFVIDVLGGVDLQQIERMICTLRITHKNYPPMRSTLDLYNDTQTDKLIRTLCEKWGVTLMEVSKTVHSFISQLESHKLERLRYPQGDREKAFEMSEEEQQTAKKYLSDKNLITNLQKDLRQIGILGEDENALTLFLAMASHKSENPFSVLCLAKSGIGKSYLLQKLSECMPKNTFSFHTQISENALYYFDSKQIDGKTLFIEDLGWTNAMLSPLATLQTQGRLIKTRVTKDKDGMLHSTTFEVSAKLCLIACAYAEKNYEGLSLPFFVPAPEPQPRTGYKRNGIPKENQSGFNQPKRYCRHATPFAMRNRFIERHKHHQPLCPFDPFARRCTAPTQNAFAALKFY